MKVIDTHCDLLSRMLVVPEIDFGREGTGADISLPGLRMADSAVQIFALYLSESLLDRGITPILRMIDILRSKILSTGEVTLIRTVSDVNRNWSTGKIGALLSLEGVDCLGGNLTNLQKLYELGVRFAGITWNHANWAADGVMESRGAGFTDRGRELIDECNRIGIILDVSHLSDRGFEELAGRSRRPFIASHSNARRICPHPRNLTDEQIQAIVAADGRISLTFVPWFIAEQKPQVHHLLRHIDHLCSLGAAKHIGFGSDFDGFADKIPGLASPADYPALASLLVRYYSEEEAVGFLSGNWRRFLQQNLPL